MVGDGGQDQSRPGATTRPESARGRGQDARRLAPIALPAVGARAGAAAGEIEGTPGAGPAMKKGPE